MALCSLEDIRRDSIAVAMSKFKGNAKSVTLQNNVAIIRWGGQYKIKDRDSAYRMAQSNSNRVSKWASEKFGDKYKNGWTTINNSKLDAIEVYFQIPQNLLRDYRTKKEYNLLSTGKSEEPERIRTIDYYMGDAALMEQEEGMYQLTNPSKESPENKIDNFLKDFLKGYGIDVKYVDNIKDRTGLSAVAIADIANRVIQISKTKADITTLPEEASHFIVEMLQNNKTLYNSMYRLAKQSSEYQDVYSTYSNIYKDNEDKLVKETMAKILSKYIIKREKSMTDLPTNNQNLLTRIKNWILSFFGNMNNIQLQAELDDIFGRVTNTIKSGDIELDSSILNENKQVYQQQDKVLELLMKSISRLEKRAAILDRKADSQDNAKRVRAIRLAAQGIRDRVEADRNEAGIRKYLKHVNKEELMYILRDIEKYKEDPSSIDMSSSAIIDMKDIINVHSDVIMQLQYELSEDKDYEHLYNSIKGDLDNTITQLIYVKNHTDKLTENRVRNLISEMRIEGSTYTADQLLKSSIGDMGYLETYFGSMSAASDEVLRMVYRLVSDIYNNTHRQSYDRGMKMLKAQLKAEKAGFKSRDLHEFDENGNKTGYLISSVKWGEYWAARGKTVSTILEKLGKDNYYDVKKADLTKSEKKIVSDEWNKFNKKYSSTDRSGQYLPNPPENTKFKKMMQNKAFADYYNTVKEIHDEAKDKLPIKFRSGRFEYMLPQIRKDIMQTLKGGDNPVLKEIGSRIKESFTITEDDIEYGGRDVLRDINGKVVKLIPVHYTSPVKDPKQLSDDITSMYTLFAEMAENFKALSSRVDDMLLIKEAMGNRMVEAKHGKSGTKIGKETNAYKALDDFIDAFFYGKEKTEQYIHLPNGKRIPISKAADKVRSWVRSSNLFMNLPTIISGYAKSSIDSKLEDFYGKYSTQESKLFAEREFDSNLPYLMANVNKRKKSTKMELFFESLGIMDSIKEKFKRMDIKTGIARKTADEFIYGPYSATDYRVSGKLALAIADNLRLVDGKWLNKAQFDRKFKGKGKWSDYSEKTLYKAYELKNGVLSVKDEFKKYVTDDIINIFTNTAKQRLAAITGMLGRLDRGAIYRNMWGRLLMLHRGWMPLGATERFKKSGWNYQTGEYDEGYYNTMARAIWGFLSSKGLIKQRLAAWNMATQEEWQKANVKRFMGDLMFLALTMTIAALVNGIISDDDDDNEWVKQYLGYQTNRILLEQSAFFSLSEFFNLLNSPSAATHTIQDMQNLIFMFADFSPIEKGPYEGMYRFERTLIRRSLLKNLFEIGCPEEKNKYIKSKIL